MQESDFYCPLTLQVFDNPVVLVDNGKIYEKSVIENFCCRYKVIPKTKIPTTGKLENPPQDFITKFG